MIYLPLQFYAINVSFYNLFNLITFSEKNLMNNIAAVEESLTPLEQQTLEEVMDRYVLIPSGQSQYIVWSEDKHKNLLFDLEEKIKKDS